MRGRRPQSSAGRRWRSPHESPRVSAVPGLRGRPSWPARVPRLPSGAAAAAPARPAVGGRRRAASALDWEGGVRVLVACEFSGVVRRSFAARGHDAVSCDILPAEDDGPHLTGDVRQVLGAGWDMMIAHPPCTHLAVSGARWFAAKQAEQAEALDFVRGMPSSRKSRRRSSAPTST